MVCTSGDYGTLSCPAFQILPMLPCWRPRHGCQSALSSIPAAAHAVLAAGPLSYFSALASSSFCRSLPAISHLSSAGRQLVRCLYSLRIGFHRVSHSIGFYRGFLGSPYFLPILWFHLPGPALGNPLGLAWCFFLDARMGGVQSVLDPRVR
jgi:hypothetical protein